MESKKGTPSKEIPEEKFKRFITHLNEGKLLTFSTGNSIDSLTLRASRRAMSDLNGTIFYLYDLLGRGSMLQKVNDGLWMPIARSTASIDLNTHTASLLFPLPGSPMTSEFSPVWQDPPADMYDQLDKYWGTKGLGVADLSQIRTSFPHLQYLKDEKINHFNLFTNSYEPFIISAVIGSMMMEQATQFDFRGNTDFDLISKLLENIGDTTLKNSVDTTPRLYNAQAFDFKTLGNVTSNLLGNF